MNCCDAPLVLIETVASRQVVVTGCARAEARGIRRGMTLAEARALCPGLVDAPHEPEKDRKALEALARWMVRFSPIVSHSLSDFSSTPSGLRGFVSPCLFLDVTGSDRLFGGLPNLVEQVHEAMVRLRVHAQMVVAPTPGAAYALASTGRENGRIVPADQLRRALASLPPIGLRISDQTAGALHHLGIETIDQLMALPREALPARFGGELLTRLDQALGRIAEPLVGVAHDWPVEAGVEFDGPVDSLEAIYLTFQNLIERVTLDLLRRGAGARRVELHLERPTGSVIGKTILLSRASRDPVNLFNLMRCAMEGMEEEAKRRSDGATERRRGKKVRSVLARESCHENVTPDGFTAIRLCVPVHERISDEQIALMEQEDQAAHRELDSLVERLILRLGEERVSRVELLESHLPERAYALRGAHEPVSNARAGIADSLPPRPLHLLESPREIEVMVSPSHDLDGRPISITEGGTVRRVVHAVGPERIAGIWWEGRDKTRDYFAVEDTEGRRSWVFRVNETRKWYVQGEF